jgi:methylthioribose-1-phosphate isomerase
MRYDDPSLLSPLRWDAATAELLLIDQLRLPQEEIWHRYRDHQRVAEAIRTMVVRGAPAIGIAAAYGVALAAQQGEDLDAALQTLGATRPTAVNLFWALGRMRRRIDAVRAAAGGTPDSGVLFVALLAEAEAIRREDIEMCLRMSEFGAPLLPEGNILTHCNAGGLATGGYGTAIGVIRTAHRQGRRIAVFADETRPYLQGARLTTWELQRAGVPVTLITDSMAGHLMARREVAAVIVGADRIARSGDVANKIGTYSLAVLAHAHSIPFFVAAPRSTLDLSLPDGSLIPIEERSVAEVTSLAGIPIAPAGVPARHPAFDITPARLISAIITDGGVAHPPYELSLCELAGV